MKTETQAKPVAFSMPLIKKLPYSGLLKAIVPFISTEETRHVLNHVCFRKGLLYATTGHIAIELDIQDMPVNQFVEEWLYKVEVTKENMHFQPYTVSDSDPAPKFPDMEQIFKPAPAEDCFSFDFSVGDYLGITKDWGKDTLGDLAYKLAQEYCHVHLKYLKNLPLNLQYTVSGRKAETKEKGMLSAVHFNAPGVHVILMPLRP